MNVDKSATLMYIAVVWVTVSRSTNKEKTMNNDEAKHRTVRGGDVTTNNPLLRHRPRSASISYLTTTEHVGETPYYRKQRFHVASFDFSYMSAPFIVSVWIVLSSVAKIGQLMTWWERLMYRST